MDSQGLSDSQPMNKPNWPMTMTQVVRQLQRTNDSNINGTREDKLIR